MPGLRSSESLACPCMGRSFAFVVAFPASKHRACALKTWNESRERGNHTVRKPEHSFRFPRFWTIISVPLVLCLSPLRLPPAHPPSCRCLRHYYFFPMFHPPPPPPPPFSDTFFSGTQRSRRFRGSAIAASAVVEASRAS